MTVRRLWAPLAALLLAMAFGPVPAAAQGLSLGNAADGLPIDILADSGIEWQQNAQVYIARGNAVAKRGNTEVHADTLTAHYRPAKGAEGGTEIYRLDADGHVRINNETDTVVGDQAVYDVDQAIAIVTGKALKLTTPTDVVTARDSLEWYDQKQVAVARGDAVAVRGEKRIRADVLTAHFIQQTPQGAPKPGGAGMAEAKPPAKSAPAAAKPPVTPGGTGMANARPPAKSAPAAATAAPAKPGAAAQPIEAGEGSSRISRIDAEGNVVVSTATDIARGDYGVDNAETGIVTLLGNVTITRGQNAIRGQYAVVDLNTNVSHMMTLAAKPGMPAPRVEGIFVRQDVTPAAPGHGTAKTVKPAAGGAPKR